jgi:hypothetical protein
VSVPGKRLLYAATVFWSALLLLLVQPVLTKAILPWFGGSAGVWTTSMLFYQSLLLLGYAYAHVLARRLPLRAQVGLHITLLLVSLLVLPLQPSAGWKPNPGQDPVWRILGLLFATVGLPYFLLSSTSPLLQSWFARSAPSETPYRLFALSNLGSLVALLLYPIAVEPTLSTRTQMVFWSLGYAGFFLLCSFAAFQSRAGEPLPEIRLTIDRRVWTWLALSACPSILWLAIANHLSQDVAAVPFLWIVPLALYLLSFVLCFESHGWYNPRLFRWLLPAAWIGIMIGVGQQGMMPIRLTLLVFAGAVFVLCMFCHGELARQRPESNELTAYFLTIAAGGAAGGIFVGLIAPRIFNEFLELPIGVLGSVLLALWLLYRFPQKRVLRVGLVATAAALATIAIPSSSLKRHLRVRNFYGTLQVNETGAADGAYRSLFNGTIQHGVQFISPDRSRIPTTYYGPASGAAIAIDKLRNGPMRVGVIGLGTGTLATYGKKGDVYRFYDINPVVVDIAQTQFRYLRESEAHIEVVVGDARLSLEVEAPQNFDVLAVDAFAGDSIPVHLLTNEAFGLYFKHLKSGGALAIHVTNKHLDLAPVVDRIARQYEAEALIIHNSSELMNRVYASSWMVVTKNTALAGEIRYLSSPIRESASLWTDDYSNLLRILK